VIFLGKLKQLFNLFAFAMGCSISVEVDNTFVNDTFLRKLKFPQTTAKKIQI
jgi:hypothetical protein